MALRVPSTPLIAGIAVLAVSAGGAVTAAGADITTVDPMSRGIEGSPAISGSAGEALLSRTAIVSRSSIRDAASEATNPKLIALAEKQKAERDANLDQMRADAAKQAAKIKENRWELPMYHYSITATYGEYGLWASSHTGLDFNGDTGDLIKSVANGTVTFVGYDGSYGNKTVVTLDDGTEIWYAHQNTMFVKVGQSVRGGTILGTVGATGNVTGSHLHVEVRPGGGEPVDPFGAFVAHGIVP